MKVTEAAAAAIEKLLKGSIIGAQRGWVLLQPGLPLPGQLAAAGSAQREGLGVRICGRAAMWRPDFLARGTDPALASASLPLRRGFQVGGDWDGGCWQSWVADMSG